MGELRRCAAPCCNETRLPWGPFCSAWCEETTEYDSQNALTDAHLRAEPDLDAVWFEMEKMYGAWGDYVDVYFRHPCYQAEVFKLKDGER